MSDENKIDIIPYILDTTISYVRVYIDNFELNALDAWVKVCEFDKNDKFVNVNRVYLPPEVYSEWSRDDMFVIDYALDQLGFERRPTVEIVFPN